MPESDLVREHCYWAQRYRDGQPLLGKVRIEMVDRPILPYEERCVVFDSVEAAETYLSEHGWQAAIPVRTFENGGLETECHWYVRVVAAE